MRTRTERADTHQSYSKRRYRANSNNAGSWFSAMARSAPRLTAEHEAALCAAWHAGSHAARDHLVRANLRVVTYAAFDLAGYGLPIEDLESEGCTGLLRSIERFDPECGIRLSAFARVYVRRCMLHYIAHTLACGAVTDLRRTRLFFRLRRDADEIRRVFLDENSDAVAVLAARYNVAPQKVPGILMQLDYHFTQFRDTDPDTADPGDDPEAIAINTETAATVRAALGCLTEQERAVVEAHWLADRPLTMAEIGARMKPPVSRQRVQQIEAGARAKLAGYLAGSGVR
jgi:RNA polymerase sigma factor (sigma-70 family)